MDNIINRLKNNEYAMMKSFDLLKEAIGNFDRREIYKYIGELLLWIITTEEWHLKHNENSYTESKQNEGNQIISGLRAAYNLVKHNMLFDYLHTESNGLYAGENVFCGMGLYCTSPTIIWDYFDSSIHELKYEKQAESYKKYLSGRNMILTFEKAVRFLEEENNKILNQHN